MSSTVSPVTRIWNLVREEKTDISAIYFYAIFNGAIQLTLPVGIQAIIGFIMAGTLSASLILLISLIVIGVLVVGLLQMAQMKVIEKIQQKIFVRFADAFAQRIPRLDLGAVDSYYLPELVNRFFDTASLQKSIAKLLLDLPVAAIQIIFGLILLSFYHPAFILFGILLISLLWAILYFTSRRGLQSSLAESTYKYAVAGWFEELARVVKSFKFSQNTGLAQRKADERTVGYLRARTEHFLVLITQYRSLVAFKVLITAAMLIVGVNLLLDQQINIGEFVAAEIIIMMVLGAVEKIIGNLDSVYDVLTSIEKISKLTDKPVEAPGSYLLPERTGIALRGSGIRFGYSDRQVLDGVSFDIPAGAKAAITGTNGSGKSTLLKLFTGVYPNMEGALLVNEVPLFNYELESLRSRTGIFFLYENIFNGTLWENITMGRNVDAGHVNTLVRAVGLGTFLESLPRGFDSELDPAGKRLPQNVIHKILLIRALAHRPRLLLMEDPWRVIEEPYRSGVRELLLQLPETTVVIATNDAAYTDRASVTISL